MEHSEFTTRAMLIELDVLPISDESRDVTVYLSKVGGGTVGKAYEGRWRYRVVQTSDNLPIATGDDLNTDTPKTHSEAAEILLDFLGVWH